MCSQCSPPVGDTLCMTFWDKSLIEFWCQTQKYGYTNFDCSLSQSHLLETAVALKHQEYSHTFYRAKYVHHLQNEEWLSWLTVLSCWHHKILVVTSDWIALLCGYCTGSLYCAKYCVFTAIWQKRSFGTVSVVSRVNAYLEWIWCTETLIEYHMYLFWHDQVCRHRLRHMGR